LIGKSLAIQAIAVHRIPIFNDPGKEFEVQLIGPDLEQLFG